MSKLFRVLSFALLVLPSLTWALAPIESLVLGNFSENYSENTTDPLNYVFSRDKNQVPNQTQYRQELSLYRGFYEEGKNLNNFCKNSKPIRYATDWDKTQVLRSIMAEVQYIGLDLMTRSIPQYAKALEFSSEEYSNMIDHLVGNFCSTNLSVISKKELKNNFMIKFDKENTFRLPAVDGNPYFPDHLNNFLQPKQSVEQEFKFTIKLFQSLCSWNGNPDSPGLMVPIFHHPALMSFFFRQMNNKKLEWKEIDNSIILANEPNSIQVWCENLICRPVKNSDTFFSKIIFSVGGTNFNDDLKRLYCEDFRTIDYKTKDLDERLVKMIKSRTLDEENFLNSQFIALITGIPDFLLRADKFSKIDDIIRSSMDYSWNLWAKSQYDLLNRELYFEEPLTLELVDRALYFNSWNAKFRVAFDVNMGEFDRITQRQGKVRVGFNLKVPRNFLNFYRNALSSLSASQKKEKERLTNRFKLQISKQVQEARDKFIIPPWKGDLESIIVNEITTQLFEISDKRFRMSNSGNESIPIEINYGTFALKYVNHQKNILKSEETSKAKKFQ